MCFQSKEFELLPSISAPSYVLSRIPTFTKIIPTTRKNTKNNKKKKKQINVLTSLPLQAVLDNNLVVVQLLLRHGAQNDQKVIH